MVGAGALALAGVLGVRSPAAAALGSAVPVRTIDPLDEAFDDLEPIGRAIGAARIVQLGECSHGAGVDFKAKARLVKFLHARMGFDVLVWESGLHGMRRVNAGLRAGMDPVAAARLGVFGLWSATADVKPLFAYAQASLAGPRPLEMAGFDCQFSARGADQALADDLRAFVRTLRDPAVRAAALADAETALAAYAKVAARAASDADVRAGEADSDRVLAAIDRPANAFQPSPGRREIAFMARSLENLRVFTRLTFGSQPGAPGALAAQPKDETDFFNRREAQNARNLRWLVEEGYPGRKLVVWAHNVHVIDAAFAPGFAALRHDPAPGDMVPMGWRIARAFGGEVFTLGMTSFSGEDRWVSSKGPATPIPTAGPDTLEAQLHELRRPYLFLNTADLDPAERRRLGLRVFVPAPGAAASSPSGLFPGPDVLRGFHGILFIDQARGATPLTA